MSVRGGGALVALLAVALLSGCETAPSAPALTSARPDPANRATPSANVGKMRAWRDAELLSNRGEGRSPAIGSGASMQPVYGENTILVISKVPFEELRPGMTVAYLNSRGFQVVHQLLEPVREGWRVMGINNEVEDRDTVTRLNLLGVVYASLAYGAEDL